MSSEIIKKKILVVDDEAGSRLLLRSYLEKNGFEVLEAVSGQEALALIKKTPPDLIVMDKMMPQIDGMKASALIKLDRRFFRIPVIMLTASADKEVQEQSVDAGVDFFMNKPLNPVLFIEKVNELLARE